MKRSLIFSFCVAACICLIALVIVPFILHTDNSYSSQEVFLTQEEFDTFKQNFKMRVYEDNLTLQTFDVLASEPPIIVNFRVIVPYDYDFPYGEGFSRDLLILPIIALSFIAVILIVILPASIIFD